MMDGIVCTECHSFLTTDLSNCPGCGTAIILSGEAKNIIDQLQPNCLIHRYEGSDLLEPAFIIKAAKKNVKVATKLKDYARPIVVDKAKVYSFNQNVLSSIQALRNERTATMRRYDQLIETHWKNLKPYPQP